MDCDEAHRRRVAAFPEDVRKAHEHSSNHRAEIVVSGLCGCFYCRTQFAPSKIVEWVDEDASGVGQTALCPNCGIDSVIGDRSGYEPSKDLLTRMYEHWF